MATDLNPDIVKVGYETATVAELVEALQKVPQDAIVAIGGTYGITDIQVITKNNVNLDDELYPQVVKLQGW